jgi:hypothetical protein
MMQRRMAPAASAPSTCRGTPGRPVLSHPRYVQPSQAALAAPVTVSARSREGVADAQDT